MVARHELDLHQSRPSDKWSNLNWAYVLWVSLKVRVEQRVADTLWWESVSQGRRHPQIAVTNLSVCISATKKGGPEATGAPKMLLQAGCICFVLLDFR